LWAQRSRRFGFAVWATTLAAAVALGFYAQRSVTHLQRYLESLNPQWMARFMRGGVGFDPTQSKTALERRRTQDLWRNRNPAEPKNGSRPRPICARRVIGAQVTSVVCRQFEERFRKPLVESPPESRIWPLLPAKTNTAW
jgi:hypothetical protein